MKNVFFKLLLIVQILLIWQIGYSQSPNWDNVFFSDNEELNYAAYIDGNDNIYSLIYNVDSDRILVKMDQDGQIEWNKNISELLKNVSGPSATVESFSGSIHGMDGNDEQVYVVGQDNSTTGRGVVIASGLLDLDEPVLVERIKGSTNVIRDIKVSGDDMYITGEFGATYEEDPYIYFDNDLSTALESGYKSAFVAKFSISSGQLVWARLIGGISEEDINNNIRSKNLDHDEGHVYVSGEFKNGVAIFRTSDTEVYTLFNPNGTYSAFLAKLDQETGYLADFDPIHRIGTQENIRRRIFRIRHTYLRLPLLQILTQQSLDTNGLSMEM